MFAAIQPAFAASTLTRPNNTTAYAQNDLIASSTTAGSVVVPDLAIPRDDASILTSIVGKLNTNYTTGLTGFQVAVDLWRSAPTFTNGDNGAWAVATGATVWVGRLVSQVSDAYSIAGDGSFLHLTPGHSYLDGYATAPIRMFRSPGDRLYWSLRLLSAAGYTPAANQTFTLSLAFDQM